MILCRSLLGKCLSQEHQIISQRGFGDGLARTHKLCYWRLSCGFVRACTVSIAGRHGRTSDGEPRSDHIMSMCKISKPEKRPPSGGHSFNQDRIDGDICATKSGTDPTYHLPPTRVRGAEELQQLQGRTTWNSTAGRRPGSTSPKSSRNACVTGTAESRRGNVGCGEKKGRMNDV